MDKTWLSANRQYIDTLIRDMANPTTSDTWFPQWRSFDWYHGHSWAHGLFPQWDGKVGSCLPKAVKDLALIGG